MSLNYPMQRTRRLILDILRHRQQATVDEIVRDLQAQHGAITPVTVRHHLAVLQQEGLIGLDTQRRNTPGRPQHVYSLTERASELLPTNYRELSLRLLEQIQAQLPPEGVNVLLEGVADSMAQGAAIGGSGGEAEALPLESRLDIVTDYLNQHGYRATWEYAPDSSGYLLHTSNCPYHALAQQNDALCSVDMRLVASLTGIIPRRLARMTDGDERCSYLLPSPAST